MGWGWGSILNPLTSRLAAFTTKSSMEPLRWSMAFKRCSEGLLGGL